MVNGSLQYKQITEEKFKLNSNSYPSSQCGSPCAKHEVMVHLTQDKCCHSCSPCTTFPWVKHSETVCHLCKHEDFLQPNANRTDCELAPSTYFGLHEVLGVLIMVLAIAGFLCALLTLFLFFRYINTPIIKASGRELSLITLMGVLLGYLTTLFLIVPPSLSVCVFVRFFYGLSYVMCYAAILTKANRIMRIFHRNSASQTKVRYISPMSQILIVLLLVTFQGVINTIWLILRPPTVQLKSDLDVDKQQVQVYTYCGAFSDENMVITLLFPAVLLLFCLFYAFKTRKVPGAFSEAKPIFVAVYTTSVLWLAFIPVFFTIQLMSIRIFVLAMAKIVNATVTLVCMFGPKLHLALFHPEKNNKETILGRRNTRTHVDLGDTDPTDAPNTFGRSRLDQSRPSETPLLKMN